MKYTLTIRQTCEATSLGRSSIYGLIKAGELERIKLGTRSLITVSSVEALIERSRTLHGRDHGGVQ